MEQTKDRLQDALFDMVETYVKEAARALNIPYALRLDYDETVAVYSIGMDLFSLTMDDRIPLVQQCLEEARPVIAPHIQRHNCYNNPIVSIVCRGFGIRFINGSSDQRVWFDVNVGLTH